jgi:hypothetical protein
MRRGGGLKGAGSLVGLQRGEVTTGAGSVASQLSFEEVAAGGPAGPPPTPTLDHRGISF